MRILLDALVVEVDELWNVGLKLKPQKLVYGVSDLNILVWHIDKNGRLTQREKVYALRSLASPKSHKE